MIGLALLKGNGGGYVHRLVELEGLSLCAETVDGYLKVLKDSHFSDIEVVNVSEEYALYNEEIVRNLGDPQKQRGFIQLFNEQLYLEAVEGYSAIAKAMHIGEILVTQFVARKR